MPNMREEGTLIGPRNTHNGPLGPSLSGQLSLSKGLGAG